MATLTFEADAYRAGTRQLPHWHDALHLSIVLSGHVYETVGGVTEEASALSVVAKDAGVVHANHFSPSTRLARLTLRDGTLGRLADDPARSCGWHWKHDAAVAKPYLRLVRRSNGVTCTFSEDDADLVDLIAALTARAAAPARGTPPAWLTQTMSELRAGWNGERTVANVAGRAGVHPVYLARCVRRWYQTGLSEELRRLRLQSASAAVSQMARTVSDVAHEHGFSDEPHFCRQFAQGVGMTPGRYRKLIRSLDYTWRGGA